MEINRLSPLGWGNPDKDGLNDTITQRWRSLGLHLHKFFQSTLVLQAEGQFTIPELCLFCHIQQYQVTQSAPNFHLPQRFYVVYWALALLRISLSLDFQWNTDGGTILTPHSYYEGKPFWFVIIWFCLFWWMVYFTKLYVCIQKNLLASTLTLFTGVTFLHCSIEVLHELRWAHWLCQGLRPLDWSKTPLDIFFLNLWLKSKDDNDGFKS